MTLPWKASKTPCPASPAATIHGLSLNPSTAAAPNTLIPSNSATRTCPAATHHGKQDIVRGDDDKHGRVKRAIAVESNQPRKARRRERQQHSDSVCDTNLPFVMPGREPPGFRRAPTLRRARLRRVVATFVECHDSARRRPFPPERMGSLVRSRLQGTNRGNLPESDDAELIFHRESGKCGVLEGRSRASITRSLEGLCTS